MKTSFRSLAFAGALVLLASPAVGIDDWERARIQPDTLIRGVSIPSAFKGLDGKSQPAGFYDLKLHKGTQGILIGLLKNGKTVAEFPGTFVPGAVPPPDPDKSRTGDGSVKPGQTRLQDFHFDAASKVSFGGGAGKISCSNNLQPGRSQGSINFLLPAVQVQGK